jgi:hypothetical protein
MDVTFTPKDLPHACTSNYEMHPEIGAVKLQDIMATSITEVEYQVLSERATSSVWFSRYLLIFKFVKEPIYERKFPCW